MCHLILIIEKKSIPLIHAKVNYYMYMLDATHITRVKKTREVCRVFFALAVRDYAKINYIRVQYTEDFI